MDDQEAAGSDCPVLLQSGTRVRFATPLFVIKATVVSHRPPTLVIDVDGKGEWVIPLADWYLEQSPDSPEHICVIDDADDDSGVPERYIPDAHDRWIYVYEAAEMAKVEEKQLRRYIRKGDLPAHKDNGMWMIDRDRFLAFAGDHGWL